MSLNTIIQDYTEAKIVRAMLCYYGLLLTYLSGQDFAGQQLVEQIARVVLIATTASISWSGRSVLVEALLLLLLTHYNCSDRLLHRWLCPAVTDRNIRCVWGLDGYSGTGRCCNAPFIPYNSRSMQVVLPPWPMFNRHPVKWLPVVEENAKSKES